MLFESLLGDGSSTASSTLPAFFAIFTVIPILLILTSGTAMASNPELLVHRVQQYDFQSSPRGCRSSVLNFEAKTLGHGINSASRKCVMIRLLDLVKIDMFDDLISKASGLLILIPESKRLSSLTEDELEVLVRLERTMLHDAIQIPVYFTSETEELASIYNSIGQGSTSDSNASSSALQTVFANAYQIVVAGSQPTPIKDPLFTNIEGRLYGQANNDQLPSVVVTAYYDSFGVTPGLSFGTDSNGSGCVALLELARLFSKLYASQRIQAKANIIFLLSSGGKFSFLGTKKWIDEQLENTDSTLLPDSHFSISLDALASKDQTDLFMHVSKNPKEKSSTAFFLKHLQDSSARHNKNGTLVHKKINLAEDTLAWEHERFTFRRLPAFTVSAKNTHKDLMRSSIFDTCDSVDVASLATNIEIIAESLASLVFPQIRTKSLQLFNSELKVSRPYIRSMLKQLCSQPRSQQLLLTKKKGNSHVISPLVSSLEAALKKSVRNTAFRHYKLDQREPEVVFYEPTSTTMNLFNVKHALFDLVLSLGIAAYLTILYFFITYFDELTTTIKTLKINKESSNGVSSRYKQQ